MQNDKRASLTDLQRLSSIQFPFEPVQHSHSGSATYNKATPIGASAGMHIFSGTDNEKIPIELVYDRVILAHKLDKTEGDIVEMIEEHRNLLLSFGVPFEMPDGTIGGAPPPLHLFVPGIMSLRVRLITWNFSYPKRAKNGTIMVMRASLQFEEAPIERFTSLDLFADGMFRHGQ